MKRHPIHWDADHNLVLLHHLYGDEDRMLWEARIHDYDRGCVAGRDAGLSEYMQVRMQPHPYDNCQVCEMEILVRDSREHRDDDDD